MGRLDEMLGVDDPPAGPAGLREAVVHRAGPDGLFIRLTGGPQSHVHGPCRWSTDTADDYPPPGTRCLAARSDRRVWWVLQFDRWPN